MVDFFGKKLYGIERAPERKNRFSGFFIYPKVSGCFARGDIYIFKKIIIIIIIPPNRRNPLIIKDGCRYAANGSVRHFWGGVSGRT